MSLSVLVFYSDHGDGVDSLADQSDFPTDSYENQVTRDEVGSEGNNGAFYTPGENDPGYLFTPIPLPVQIEAQYHFISDGVVPEPGSLALLATGGLPLLGILRRRRLAGV